MKIRVVLFDWDGTLIRSLEWKIRNGGILFSEGFGVPAPDVEAAYRRHSGIPRRELFAAICEEVGLPALGEEQYAMMSARFSDMNRRVLLDPSTPGLLPEETPLALQALREAGRVLYVSSSADQQEIIDIARSLGLYDYFAGTGGEILGSKPGFYKGKQHVEHVCREQQVGLDEILFVGDEPSDIALGKEAGVWTAAKVGTYPAKKLAEAEPDILIESLMELPVKLANG
jgi:phosphoglycolate phosphatase-like HAD superfamily hydrolase